MTTRLAEMTLAVGVAAVVFACGDDLVTDSDRGTRRESPPPPSLAFSSHDTIDFCETHTCRLLTESERDEIDDGLAYMDESCPEMAFIYEDLLGRDSVFVHSFNDGKLGLTTTLITGSTYRTQYIVFDSTRLAYGGPYFLPRMFHEGMHGLGYIHDPADSYSNCYFDDSGPFPCYPRLTTYGSNDPYEQNCGGGEGGEGSEEFETELVLH